MLSGKLPNWVSRERRFSMWRKASVTISHQPALGLANVWVDRQTGHGIGMTPPTNAEPDLRVTTLAELAALHRAEDSFIMLRTYPLDFYLDHSPEEIWPIMIDTARLNEATRFPRHSVTQTARPDGSVERIAAANSAPLLPSGKKTLGSGKTDTRSVMCNDFAKAFSERSPAQLSWCQRATAPVFAANLAWRAAT